MLERVAAERGAPRHVHFDHGPEFLAYALADWCPFNGIDTAFIDPGSSWQNAWIESFNGKDRGTVNPEHGTESRPYVVVSADGHCGADVWDYRPYLEVKYHDEFDEWARSYHDGWANLEEVSGAGHLGATSFFSPYNWDSASRLSVLDHEGIAAEVLFPNTAPPFYPSGAITAPGPRSTREYELRFAGVKAHNRWLADFCAEAPGRRAGIAQIFLNDVGAAVAEIHWARDHGLMGILLPSDHLLQLANLYYPSYDPVWSACVDVDLPVGRHGVICAEPASVAGAGAPAVGLFESYIFAQRGLDHLVLSGVFERFPGLKFVVSEVHAAWVLAYGRQLDQFVSQAATPGTIPYAFAHEAASALTMAPSDYIRRNCYFGTFFDQADVDARDGVGVDRLMWGADFPHKEGTSPFSREALRRNLSGLPDAEIRQLVGGAAAQCYGFDLERLQVIADRIGPTPTDLAKPLGEDDLPAYPAETLCSTFAPQSV